MAKDWEYHKDRHIEELIGIKLSWFKRIEQRKMTPIENIAFLYLIDYANGGSYAPLELEVVAQQKIDSYTVDFLIEHSKLGVYIIVECDGHDFHEKTKKQAQHDKKRDRYFTKRGYYVLRYTGSQICEDPEEIIRDIDEIIISAMENKSNIS